MPLEDGRFGACRILGAGGSRTFQLVEASAWIGAAPPTLADLVPWRTLLLTHHAWKSVLERAFVQHAPPPEFRLLGVVALTRAERELTGHRYSRWDNLPPQVLLQWRWDHDREALLAEEARRKGDAARAADIASERERERRSRLTFAAIRKAAPLSDWEGRLPAPVVAQSRALLAACLERLERLGRTAREEDRLGALRALVEGFNALDAAQGPWIETVERERLCALVADLAAAAGLPGREELADPWRTW